MTISPPPSIYLTGLFFHPQPSWRYSSSSRNYTRPGSFWGSQPGPGYCHQRRLGRELESQLQLVQGERLLFFMNLLETRARKKGHLFAMSCRFALRSARVRLEQPDLFRLPHTHLSFSLLHIHTHQYI